MAGRSWVKRKWIHVYVQLIPQAHCEGGVGAGVLEADGIVQLVVGGDDVVGTHALWHYVFVIGVKRGHVLVAVDGNKWVDLILGLGQDMADAETTL